MTSAMILVCFDLDSAIIWPIIKPPSLVGPRVPQVTLFDDTEEHRRALDFNHMLPKFKSSVKIQVRQPATLPHLGCLIYGFARFSIN